MTIWRTPPARLPIGSRDSAIKYNTQDLSPQPAALDDGPQPEVRDIHQDFEAGAVQDDSSRSLPSEDAGQKEEQLPENLVVGPLDVERTGDAAVDDLAWLRELQSQYQQVEGLSSAESKKDDNWSAANELSQDLQKREDEGVPSWVEEIYAGPLHEEEAASDLGLSPAELPSWLDATRHSGTHQDIY